MLLSMSNAHECNHNKDDNESGCKANVENRTCVAFFIFIIVIQTMMTKIFILFLILVIHPMD